PYVDGGSLRDRLTRERQLSLEVAQSIAREVADALDYAHRHGVIHRDVKPENILLQGDRPVLADFGVAHVVDPTLGARLTATGITVGTPCYMSPEQALAEPVDGRADIYALGCVLYEMLTGEPPYTGPTAQAIMARMMTDAPRAITPVRPQAASLEPIVMKALARSPADRYRTAGEMAAALAPSATYTIAPPSVTHAGQVRGRRAPIIGAAMLVSAVALAFFLSRDGSRPTAGGAARIVVLPFRTTGDSARAYFTAGMTGALRTKLASVPGIEVIAATSTAAIADTTNPAAIARQLGASYALTGTVAWDSIEGGQISVRPELLAARDGRVVLAWPSPVVAATRNVFDVERDITEKIARALDVTLGAAVRARLGAHFGDNPAAYDLLLASRQGGSPEQRREMLLRAVALDSMLAPAWAALAEDAIVRFVNTGEAQDATEGATMSARAMTVAPDLAESQLARGIYHRSVTLARDSSIAYLRKAKMLAPGDATISHFLASGYLNAGRLEEALTEARRGAGLDPRSASAVTRVGRVLLWQKRANEAMEIYRQAWALPEKDIPPFALADGAALNLALGDLSGARASIARLPDARRRQVIAFLLVQIMSPQTIDDSLLTGFCERPIAPPSRDPAWSRMLACAEAARRSGSANRLHVIADSAVNQLRPAVSANPKYATKRMRFAWALLLAADTTSAIAEADSGLALLPLERDAFLGAYNAIDYALITAMAGDARRATAVLSELLNGPSPVTVAWLKADPTFDRIRADTRFQALLSGKGK
ncbi:MAG: protein kinase, partial [bacterium]